MKTVKLYQGQTFMDIIPLIPANSLINKRVMGCGATYTEIKAPRHSIIVEPNQPVIKIKCDKTEHQDDNLFGVYEGIYTADIRNYLIETMTQKRNIKIMTTPESFPKVKKAFSLLGLDMYSDCFLLFDECHKLVQDVDFRADIILPFGDFFRFSEKALVSATPIILSDPRLDTFEYIEFEPQYSIIHPLILYPTNNILESLKRVMNELGNKPAPLCIFLNSTDMIHALIKQLGIEDKSVVFCAPKSVERLNYKGFECAYADFHPNHMKKYNFFTSRFFCALDIELEEQPDLIIISDIRRVKHTALDPVTSLPQIAGRFRNGVDKIYHITTLDKNLPVYTREDLKEQITIMEGIYHHMQLMYDTATNRNQRTIYNDSLQTLPYRKFLIQSGKKLYAEEKNWFQADNYIDENLTFSYYQSSCLLKGAYQASGHFFLVEVTSGFYGAEEKYQKLVVPSKVKNMRMKRKAVIDQLEMMKEWEYTQFRQDARDSLYRAEPFLVEAYELLGKEKIEELKFSTQKVREAVILKKYEMKEYAAAFTGLIKNTFQVGMRYRVKEIKNIFLDIYQKLKLFPLKAITSQCISEYFDIKETWIGKKDKRVRAYYIARARF